MHYPDDANTFAIETQFFYGPSLLVNPVTVERSTSVSFYVPQGTWYDLYTRKLVAGAGSTITYSNVTHTDIPVLVRGGSIVPARVNSANTTTALRNQNFELIVAPDVDGKASGTLYLDDGESLVQTGTSEITFSWNGSAITTTGKFGFETVLQVTSITVMGDGDARQYDSNESLGGAWEKMLW